MKYDRDKVDQITLALLYLNATELEEGLGARAWPGFDRDTIDRLYEKGWIDDPKNKATSLHITAEGLKRSKKLFHPVVYYWLKMLQAVPTRGLPWVAARPKPLSARPALRKYRKYSSFATQRVRVLSPMAGLPVWSVGPGLEKMTSYCHWSV